MSDQRHRVYGVIKSFEAKSLKKRSIAVRIADKLTSFFGSIGFFITNLILFAFWILVNTGKFPVIPVFDPYPFVLLITFVSLEAIVLSTVVLMSQNRAGFINSVREELHMQVNLIAEREITKALWILHELAKKQGIKIEDPELEDMLKKIDESYIERKLVQQLTPTKQQPLKIVTEPVKKVAEEFEKTFNPNSKT